MNEAGAVSFRVYSSNGEKSADVATFTWRSGATVKFVQDAINRHSLNLVRSIKPCVRDEDVSLKDVDDLTTDIDMANVLSGKVKTIAVVYQMAVPSSSLSSHPANRAVAPSLLSSAMVMPRSRVARPAGTAGINQMRFIELMSLNKRKDNNEPKGFVQWSEVVKHNKPDDCWIVLNQTVYDVTTYLNYHPGGESNKPFSSLRKSGKKILAACAGKDVTDQFNRYHPWVNASLILKDLDIGTVTGSIPQVLSSLPESPTDYNYSTGFL